MTNQGEGDAGESVTQLIYNGQVLGTDAIGPVPAGGTIDREFMPCPLPPRGFEVTLFTDSGNHLDESNEDNNYTWYEWVPPPTSSPPPPSSSPPETSPPLPPPTVERTPSTPLYTWLADPASPVFEDQRVREAVGLAINEEYITDKILVDIGGVFSPEETLYWQYSGREWSLQDYDIPLARQLLSEAGYPDGFSVNIAVVPPGDKYVETIVELVIGELKDVGIVVESVAPFDLRDAIPKSSYQITIVRVY
jgi:ABC-type transport system substrate-binding protein